MIRYGMDAKSKSAMSVVMLAWTVARNTAAYNSMSAADLATCVDER
jgi:hypothetical protein